MVGIKKTLLVQSFLYGEFSTSRLPTHALLVATPAWTSWET
jgi:hypothetical protein